MRKPIRHLKKKQNDSEVKAIIEQIDQSCTNDLQTRRVIGKRQRREGCVKRRVQRKRRHDRIFIEKSYKRSILNQQTSQCNINENNLIEQVAVEQQKQKNQNIPSQHPQNPTQQPFPLPNPHLTHYLPTIHTYILQKQLEYIPNPITNPSTISQPVRSRLITWMFQIGACFKFKVETVFLAVNVVDRALGKLGVGLREVVLLAVCGLFVAAKYEELLIPHVGNFVAVFPKAYGYCKEDIIRFQSSLLILMDFNLSYICPITIINHQNITKPLPKQIYDRATQITKQLITYSGCRYWPSSRLAYHAIDKARQQYESVMLETRTISVEQQILPEVQG